jgi:hypothetical protein
MIIHNMIVEKERHDIKYDQWWDFEGELVVPRPDQRQILHIFFKCIMNWETVELTADFKKIWLCICEIILDASSPFRLYFI